MGQEAAAGSTWTDDQASEKQRKTSRLCMEGPNTSETNKKKKRSPKVLSTSALKGMGRYSESEFHLLTLVFQLGAEANWRLSWVWSHGAAGRVAGWGPVSTTPVLGLHCPMGEDSPYNWCHNPTLGPGQENTAPPPTTMLSFIIHVSLYPSDCPLKQMVMSYVGCHPDPISLFGRVRL